MSRLSDFRSRSGEHRGPTPIWSTPRRSLHPIPIRWATTAHLPGAKSPFRGKRRRTAAIRRPFRSATSNASSCRNGSLSSRWESKHGRNTAVRYPKLLPVPTDKSGGSVNVEQGARRLPYPVEEYQQNNANLQAAIQTLGAEQQNGDRSGDVMGTRVWWDCKPYNK